MDSALDKLDHDFLECALRKVDQPDYVLLLWTETCSSASRTKTTLFEISLRATFIISNRPDGCVQQALLPERCRRSQPICIQLTNEQSSKCSSGDHNEMQARLRIQMISRTKLYSGT